MVGDIGSRQVEIHAAPETLHFCHGLLVDGFQPVSRVNLPGIVRSHAGIDARDDVVSSGHLAVL